MARTSPGVGEHGEVFIKDGISSDRYTESYYGYPQGQHIVFYLLGQGCIEIISISIARSISRSCKHMLAFSEAWQSDC